MPQGRCVGSRGDKYRLTKSCHLRRSLLIQMPGGNRLRQLVLIQQQCLIAGWHQHTQQQIGLLHREAYSYIGQVKLMEYRVSTLTGTPAPLASPETLTMEASLAKPTRHK